MIVLTRYLSLMKILDLFLFYLQIIEFFLYSLSLLEGLKTVDFTGFIFSSIFIIKYVMCYKLKVYIFETIDKKLPKLNY